MWIRTAYWIGHPRNGREEEFTASINDELVPAILGLPGVIDAKALWPRRLENNPPNIACVIEVHFKTESEIDRMLASPERQKFRTRVGEIAGIFDGVLSHIDFELA